MKKVRNKIFVLVGVLMLGLSGIVYGQKGDVKLAEEYFQNQEYSKAKEIYSKLAKNKHGQQEIYYQYVQTLKQLKEYDEAQKYIKRQINNTTENLQYRIDYGLLYLDKNAEQEAQKYFKKLFAELRQNPIAVDQVTVYLLNEKQIALAEELYIQARQAGTGKYYYELASIYRLQNKKQQMLGEILGSVEGGIVQLDLVKNMLQNYLNEPEDYEMLDRELLNKVQQRPDDILYSELLIWSNLQQKSFYAAFIQSKAIDKRMDNGGTKSMEVGLIAYSNKDYESAKEIFEFIVKEFPGAINYIAAKMYMIKSKEEVVKNTFPVNIEEIRSLVEDYKSFMRENRNNYQAMTTSKNLALLYAFYLDNSDSAIVILNNAIAHPRQDPKFVAQCKLDLGDIYLFRSEPWEATLLYSQVEKSEKDQPLGHEAKLKNAKLNYFKGDFDLAQEHLDVLKLATSREIANDAMDLSLLIQDNIGLDTTTEAMEEYAKADLLMYQNKYDEAMAMLDQMLSKWKGHSLTDDILMTKAKIAEKRGEFKIALQNLEEVMLNHRFDVNGDKAWFKAAKIYEENIGDKDKAMELYQSLLVNFPASIHTVEARKRFRQLRGDLVN
jgi:tetratricopeptide (TPR) repeat protein